MKRSLSMRKTGIAIYFLNQDKQKASFFTSQYIFWSFANTVLGWWPEPKCLCRDAKAKTRELGTVLCTICFRSGRKKRVEYIGMFFTALSLISKEQKHKYPKYITHLQS